MCECRFDTGESFQALPGRGERESESTLTPEGPLRREMKVWFWCLASKAGGSRELHQPSSQLDQFSVKTEKTAAAQVKFPLHRFQFNDIPVSRRPAADLRKRQRCWGEGLARALRFRPPAGV